MTPMPRVVRRSDSNARPNKHTRALDAPLLCILCIFWNGATFRLELHMTNVWIDGMADRKVYGMQWKGLVPPLIYVLSTYRKRSTKLITMQCL